MALNGTITGSTSNKYIDVKIVWSAVQSISGNYSDVTAHLYYSRNNKGYTTSGNWSGSISINGAVKSENQRIAITYNSNTLAIANTVRVYHNNDGTKSISISASGGIAGTSLSSTTVGASISLNTIPRQATLTSAPNFNDEQNPTIKYSNSAGNSVTSLQACISITGSKAEIAYRDVSKTGNSYTFNLTEAERTKLRNAVKGTNSIMVGFYLKTVIGGVTYYSSLSKSFSVVNANPTINPTIRDTNAKTIALTGDKDKLVKYHSNAAFTVGAAAYKGASIATQSASCGYREVYAASGTFNNVESGAFTFQVMDSRKNTTTKTVNKSMLEYTRLTCILNTTAPTVQGTLTLTIQGKYFNGSFGAVDNSLILQYRMSVHGNEYGEWIDVTPKITGNTYKYENILAGLDYRLSYKFQARVFDKLEETVSNEQTIQTMPVFDWGQEDFNFNVPVTINKNEIYGNKVLYEGSTNETAVLNDKVENYKYIEIYFTDEEGNGGGYAKVEPNTVKFASLSLIGAMNAQQLNVRYSRYSVASNALAPITYWSGLYAYDTGSHTKGTNYIYITKVVGIV